MPSACARSTSRDAASRSRSGYRMTLSGGRLPRDIAVDNRSTPLALWGWVAGPISLLPGWSSSLPEEQERQNLRVAIQNAVTGV